MNPPQNPLPRLAPASARVSAAFEVDLTNCDREPVQFPGATMPHGVLLVLNPADFRIQGASANTAPWFGVDVESLLHGHLGLILDADNRLRLENALARITRPRRPQYLGCVRTLHSDNPFDVFGHRSGDACLLEFEALPAEAVERSPTERFAQAGECISALRSANTWQEGLSIAVDELRRLSGFDSVVAARFLADGSFQVMAEARQAGFPSYLDKRFPRSDIPEPGRRQMVLMPLQYGPDLAYRPVPLVVAGPGLEPLQIDLGHAVLRSTSRMCNRFYLNMGVRARLLLSLADQGELWGFFNFKNAAPRRVAYSDRLAYQSFAEMAALLLVEKEKAAQDRDLLEAKRKIAELAAGLSAPAALHTLPTRLLEMLDIAGAAVCAGNKVSCAGATPAEPLIDALLPWLDGQGETFATDSLPALFDPAQPYGDSATGLIAVRLLEPGQYLLGFRPEWVHEVQWAGNPDKPVEVDIANGEERLTARGSFEVWKQEVRGKARPWRPHESEAMADLQRAVKLAQHAQKQQDLQFSLERSNVELEDFAYIVSHDLQEPLRGIRNFSQFLAEEAGERLLQQERSWLHAIIKMGGRMSGQIDALLQYSRAGRQSLDMQAVDINALLRTVTEDLSARIGLSGVKVDIPPGLPCVVCDPIRTAAVFENLISNAIKYNDQAEKRVEVGFIEGPEPVFLVRDNGIGIDGRLQKAVFTIFRRLHGRDEYGGGTGAGLAIVRKHVERQGGRIWLESTPGLGSTFYFTLGSADE
jgi:chemotaxis family two-component system sensor kinase Cph1